MVSGAENKLKTTYYSGEKRRFNFKDYVRVHAEQNLILKELVEHGYSGIDERSKVRLLMEGIHTKEYDAVKTQILSSAALRQPLSRFDIPD
mmetsp:Transcript_2969/g.4279  ORF Transcript_2969/g.4279 Transcript_2969/m.4279 type:complete len:91 (+) Transcript_2969:516-788(+)